MTMYLKKFILLLASNMMCAVILAMAREYDAYASQPKIVKEMQTVTYMDYSSDERKITWDMLHPVYVIQVSDRDIEVLMKIVEAEAGGEDRQGKLLVANVIINRVKNHAFPDTVEQVVYQKVKGVIQFSPVADGKIDQVSISEETKEAVYSALWGEDPSLGALYFVARKIADTEKVCWFDDNLTLLFSYGGHDFFL